MMKKILVSAMILITALLVPNTVNAAAANTAYLSLMGTLERTVYIGDVADFNLTLRNASLNEARDIRLYVSCSTADVYCESTLPNLAAMDSTDFLVRVITPDSGTATTHTVSLEVRYTTISGDNDSFEYTLSVTTRTKPSGISSSSSSLEPSLVMTSPTGAVSAVVNGNQQVSVNIKNVGAGAASTVTATIEPNEKLNVSFLDSSNEIKNINAAASATLKLNVFCPKDLESGTYPVKINFVYYDGQKKAHNSSATFYVKVDNPDAETPAEKAPVLVLDGFTVSSGAITAGSAFNIGAQIKNTGDVNASNVQVALTNLDQEAIGIINSSASTYIGGFDKGASRNVSFNLVANENMDTGIYPVVFTLSYTDKDGKAYSTDYTYYVSVTGKTAGTAKGVLEVVSISEPGGTYNPGNTAKINIVLRNSGTLTIKDVKISSVLEGGAVIPKSASIQQVTSLAPGESKTVSFSFSPTSSAVTQYYTIGFNFEYNTGVKDAEKESFSQYVGLNVDNPDKKDDEEDKPKSTPKIIVSKFEVDPIIVQAGQEFDLDLVFKNTHSVKTVSNIKASLYVTETSENKGNVFTPVNSSNTLYIDEIEPKGESSHHMRMYTVPDAAPKNYIINIKFEYEDADGNQYTETEEIGINVKQTTKLDIGDIYMPTDMMQYEQTYISFQIQNTGKVTLNNLKIKFESDGGIDTSGSDIIYGNFSIGNYDWYDATLSAVMPGAHDVSLVVSYDDDSGEHKEIRYDYTVNVMEMTMPDVDMGMGFPGEGDFTEMPGEEQGFFKSHWVWFAAGGGVVIAAAVIVTVVRVKKKKKGMEQDE